MEIPEAISDIFEKPNCLLFWYFLATLDKTHEITLFAELCDDIHVIGGLVDIKQLNNVLVLDLLHDLDLGLDVLQIVIVRE